MLSNSTLSHIGKGYTKLATIQDQLATGKKITRASQDPVVAMKGMRYRTQVMEVDQFKRNLGEVYNWLETADEALDQGTQVLQRIRELGTQASNDTYNETERANIAKEVKQLREHLQSLANTKNSNKYIFNGTNTTTAPVIDMEKMNYSITDLTNGSIPNPDSVDVVHDGKTFRHSETTAEGVQVFEDISNAGNQLTVSADGLQAVFSEPNKEDPTAPRVEETLRTNDVVVANRDSISINTQNVEIELMKGVTVPVNVNPANVFNNALFGDIIRLEKALEDGNVKGPELTGYIDNMFGHINQFVSERAELGARVNRIEMMENRLMGQEVTAKRIMSENEDADLEKVIIDLTSQESIHRAALASGARIIQPTLMDFLR